MTTPHVGACDVAAIKARADAATPGPWEADGTEIYRAGLYDDDGRLAWIGETCALKPTDDANGEFIAAARSDVPELVAEVERLRAALNAVRVEIEHAEANNHHLAADCQGVPPGEIVPAVQVAYLRAALGVQS